MSAGEKLVDQYLQLCEDRQFADASNFLDPEIFMVFPGNKKFTSLPDMAEGAKGRYNWVKKKRTDFTSCTTGADTVVTSRGTLYGERLDGSPFADIRYIDFFVIRNEKIVEQHVWNDLAELGITQPNSEES